MEARFCSRQRSATAQNSGRYRSRRETGRSAANRSASFPVLGSTAILPAPIPHDESFLRVSRVMLTSGAYPFIGTGPPARSSQLTHNAADDLSPSVSADGKRMVFESTRNGKRVVWAKDLETGRERPLSDRPSVENLPIISADGSQVVYEVYTSEGHPGDGLYVVPFDGGPSRQVCDGSCDQPFNWSADNMRVVFESATADVGVLDIRTGKKTLLLQAGECKFWGRRAHAR